MAKGPTFDTITAAFASASKLNSNFASIVTSFTNTLSRDGSSPNQMNADFDMNSNDILNAKNINATDIIVGGTSIVAQVTAAAASAAAALVSELAAAASAAVVATLTKFTGLTDTPSSLSGEGNKFVKVNSGGTALEFIAGSASEPSDGDKGDITVSGGSGLVWNTNAGVIDATALATDAVETSKIKNVNVTTAKVALNAVTLNLLEHGTTGDILYYGASGEPFRLSKGTDGQFLKLASGLPSWAASSNKSNLLHVRDQQSAGSNGGSFSSGAWRTRTLNTVLTNEISGASLAANVITLPAGTYYIEAAAPGHFTGNANHKAKFRNTSDSTDTLIGTTMGGSSNNDSTTMSLVSGRFTIAGSKDFELQHQTSSSQTNNGFGKAAGFSVIEVYADVKIWEIV